MVRRTDSPTTPRCPSPVVRQILPHLCNGDPTADESTPPSSPHTPLCRQDNALALYHPHHTYRTTKTHQIRQARWVSSAIHPFFNIYNLRCQFIFILFQHISDDYAPLQCNVYPPGPRRSQYPRSEVQRETSLSRVLNQRSDSHMTPQKMTLPYMNTKGPPPPLVRDCPIPITTAPRNRPRMGSALSKGFTIVTPFDIKYIDIINP
jgi:hypothetical protein